MASSRLPGPSEPASTGRRQFLRRALALGALATSAGLLAACQQAAPPAVNPGTAPAVNPGTAPGANPGAVPGVNPGTLTVLTQAWGNGRFDSAVGGGGPANSYGRLMQGFLMARDQNATLLPGLASEWSLSKDGLTWTFKDKKKGAKFHDGREISAEDVYWSLMHEYGHDSTGTALDLINASATQALVRIVDKISVAGDTVSLSTTVPEAGFATRVSEAQNTWDGVMPKRTKFWDQQDASDYDRNPIGAGPMKLTKYVAGSRMEFERFDDYYYQPANGFPEDRRVNFKNLALLQVPEEATRVAALLAGDADIAPVSLAARAQLEAGGGRLIFGSEGIHIRAINYGCYKPQFPSSDIRVRQALAYAINKEEMRDRLFGGPDVFAVKGWEYATPSSIGYSPELDPFPFDPGKARQLLSDAGFANGQGFGKFIVNTWVSPAMPFLSESAQLVASYWRKELGLDIEVRVGDETSLKAKASTEELHGQMLWRDNETRVDGASILRSTYGDPKQAERLHNNPELFALTQGALATMDPAERHAAFNKLYLRLREEEYEMGVGYVNIPWGVGPRVVQWRPFAQAVYPSALHTVTLK